MKRGQKVRVKKHSIGWMPFEQQNFPIGMEAVIHRVLKTPNGKFFYLCNGKLGKDRYFATFIPQADLEVIE